MPGPTRAGWLGRCPTFCQRSAKLCQAGVRVPIHLTSNTPGPVLCRAAEAEQRQLAATIEELRRDVAALQRDVAGRDEAIAEKEKRILDLKHKTQVGAAGKLLGHKSTGLCRPCTASEGCLRVCVSLSPCAAEWVRRCL